MGNILFHLLFSRRGFHVINDNSEETTFVSGGCRVTPRLEFFRLDSWTHHSQGIWFQDQRNNLNLFRNFKTQNLLMWHLISCCIFILSFLSHSFIHSYNVSYFNRKKQYKDWQCHHVVLLQISALISLGHTFPGPIAHYGIFLWVDMQNIVP